MSQTFITNCFQSTHVGQVDLANMEANLNTLKSSFSGSTTPTNTVSGMFWWDTAKNRLKVRNDANSAWLGVFQGTAAFKIWVYANTAEDGWTIDATVTDRVIALKGGSGLYNRTGGGVAGETWANLKAHTHPGNTHTHNHNHMVYDYQGTGDHDRYYTTSGADTMADLPNQSYGGGGYRHFAIIVSDSYDDQMMGADMYSSLNAAPNSTFSTQAQNTADVRPAAAVGTLQYPNL